MEDLKIILGKAWHVHSRNTSAMLNEIRSTRSRSATQWKNLANQSRSLMENKYMNAFTIVFLSLVAVLAGMEVQFSVDSTSPQTLAVLYAGDWVVFTLFATEIMIRFTATEFNVKKYFSDGWNVFDVTVTVAIPVAGSAMKVFRLLRLFRVLKLIQAVPQLRVIVNALLIAATSIKYIMIMLLVAFYVFALVGLILFGENDPEVFGSLGELSMELCIVCLGTLLYHAQFLISALLSTDFAMMQLFILSCSKGFGEVMYTNYYGCDAFPPERTEHCTAPKARGYSSFVYFAVFIVVTTFTLIELFIGVVTIALEQAQHQYEDNKDAEIDTFFLLKELNIAPFAMDQYRTAFNRKFTSFVYYYYCELIFFGIFDSARH